MSRPSCPTLGRRRPDDIGEHGPRLSPPPPVDSPCRVGSPHGQRHASLHPAHLDELRRMSAPQSGKHETKPTTRQEWVRFYTGLGGRTLARDKGRFLHCPL